MRPYNPEEMYILINIKRGRKPLQKCNGKGHGLPVGSADRAPVGAFGGFEKRHIRIPFHKRRVITRERR